jgi:hypothetical protein
MVNEDASEGAGDVLADEAADDGDVLLALKLPPAPPREMRIGRKAAALLAAPEPDAALRVLCDDRRGRMVLSNT